MDQHQTTISKALFSSQKSKHKMNIRLACVENGLDNTGFHKIAAFIKSIHQNTKVAYVPTANHRNIKISINIFENFIINYFGLTNLSFFQIPSSIFPFSCVKVPCPRRFPFFHSPTYLSPLMYVYVPCP